MPMPSDPQAAALLAHILAQTRENISFLASHNYLSSTDAADITARLATAQTTDVLTNGVQALAIAAPQEADGPRRIPPPRPRAQRATALWAYNEDGQEPNDLSFSAGETIEIVDETNTDWWTGRCRGRQGLFPSNHVEKVAGAPPAVPPPNFSTPPMQPMPPMPSQPLYSPVPEKVAYRPFGAVHQVTDMPPPTGVNSVGLQQDPQQEHKKHKFGKFGNTMAQSAAGGIGFGAGAAIGGGLVNAIF